MPGSKCAESTGVQKGGFFFGYGSCFSVCVSGECSVGCVCRSLCTWASGSKLGMERNRRREAPPSREFGDGEALGPRNWVTARGREEGGGRREGGE